MDIIRWKELDSLDKLLNNFFTPAEAVAKTRNYCGNADLFAEGENLVAEIDLPGLEADKIEIVMEKNYLHITGNRTEEKAENRSYYCRQISKGKVERYLELPTDQIKQEDIKASYKNGVLKIILPISIPAKKRIEIKVEE